MTARRSRSAALSGARVFCWVDTKLAQLRGAHIQLSAAELLTGAGGAFGPGQLEQPDRGTHKFFLVAHVIAEPRLLLDEGDQIVRTRPPTRSDG